MRTRVERRGRARLWGLATALLLGVVAVLLTMPSVLSLDRESVRDFGGGRGAPVAIAFFSGDMGFHFGMSGEVAEGLAARGVPVIGFSSPYYFGRHRSRADVDAIVVDALRQTLARTGARRVVLMGQSYGADIVATTAPDLPPDLKARLAAVAMIVPARTVYFRADPIGIAYHGTPDARPLRAVRGFDAAPLICLYGVEEEDSLCPALISSGARVAGLPGGHFMRHDAARLIGTLTAQLRATVPAFGR